MPKKESHPTLFVLDGAIRHYDDGSMSKLRMQITNEEWTQIVEETVKYKVFLECLKTVAFPALNEQWNSSDDWFRLQLGVAVDRMKNIDPLLYAKYNQSELTETYSDQMRKNTESLNSQIATMRELANNSEIRVTGL